MIRNLKFAAPLLLGTLSAAAAAEVGDRWPLLAFASKGQCQLTITSSGRALQIRADGLIPNENLRFTIRNGDMKPIQQSLRASDEGALLRYYLPFRPNRPAGLVDISVAGARCTLDASAPWTRNLATIP